MSFITKPFLFIILLVVTLQLNGCASVNLLSAEKDKNYSKRLSDTRIVWRKSKDFKIKVIRSAKGYKPFITEKNRKDSKIHIAKLFMLFKNKIQDVLVPALNKHSVTVHQNKFKSLTQLRFTPKSGTSGWGIYNGDTILVQVDLVDLTESKVVWTGVIESSIKNRRKLEEKSAKLLEDFTRTLIEALNKAELFVKK
ncbi:hypothetical protein JYT31_00865 [Beggiatoa alba]|nr:hypothetical protein [Beggiatoa alba]